MDNAYPNSGILSRNDKKQEGTKQPDFNGSLDITCDHCGESFSRKLAAWVRESKTGRKFFSLSFKPPQQDASRTSSTGGRQGFNDYVASHGTPVDAPAQQAEDEDIPF